MVLIRINLQPQWGHVNGFDNADATREFVADKRGGQAVPVKTQFKCLGRFDDVSVAGVHRSWRLTPGSQGDVFQVGVDPRLRGRCPLQGTLDS